MPYLDQGEFYSEFGSFDVSITLPANYVVGATGNLTEGEKELEWLNKKAMETEALTSFSSSMAFPPSAAETKTLRYRQSNIHDFAWFADKRYHVLKGEVTLPHSKRKVTTWAMFTNLKPEIWKKSIEYINDGVHYYSLWNGDYPYDQVTAVDGALISGGGMEYPCITVIGPVQSSHDLEVTIVHEVGHNWFYGILGSNERRHAWMDEGINSYYEKRYISTKYTKAKADLTIVNNGKVGKLLNLDKLTDKKLSEYSYLINATRNLDQPMDLPADQFTQINYGAIVYEKSALAFGYLQAYLGQETFDKGMKAYFETWKFRHPRPEDLQKVLEEVSGKKLDWFFKDLVKTNKKIDYRIVSRKGDEITVQNKGGLAVPFSLSGIKDGKVTNTMWVDGCEGKMEISFKGDYDLYKIDAQENIPEVNRFNNSLRSKGLLKKLEPVKLRFLGSVYDPDRTEVYFLGISGWNNYDKYMLGLAFYNSLIPFRRFEYVIMPMYAFRTRSLNGGLNIGYNLFPEESFARNIRLGVKAEKFNYSNDIHKLGYLKIAPEVNFIFRENMRFSTRQASVSIRFINIRKDFTDYTDREPDGTPKKKVDSYLIDDIVYLLQDNRKINPYSVRISAESNPESFLKNMIEANYRITYREKRKGVDIRLFTGIFFERENIGNFPFRLDGHTGLEDYKFDEVFLGRSEDSGILSRQFIEREGGFKAPIIDFIGSSDKWMAALNLKAPFPGPLPFGVFFDFGTHSNAGKEDFNPSGFLYDMGAYFSILDGIFEVYFPFLISKDIKDNYELNNIGYADQVRFTLNLTRLNPFQALKNISY
jgi:hypothetical protein